MPDEELTQENKLIQIERIKQCFTDFSLTLPVYDEEARRTVRLALDMDIAFLIPAWFSDLATACTMYPDKFIPYLDWIDEAIDFIKLRNDKKPEIEVDQEMYQKFMHDFEIQTMLEKKKIEKYKKRNQPYKV